MAKRMKKSLALLLSLSMLIGVMSVCWSVSADVVTRDEWMTSWTVEDFLGDELEKQPGEPFFTTYLDQQVGWKGTMTGATVFNLHYTFQEDQKVNMTVRIFADESEAIEGIKATDSFCTLDIDTGNKQHLGPILWGDYQNAPLQHSSFGYDYKEFTRTISPKSGANGMSGEIRAWAQNTCPFSIFSIVLTDAETGKYLTEWTHDAIVAAAHQPDGEGGPVLSTAEATGIVTYSSRLNDVWSRTEAPYSEYNTKGLQNALLVGGMKETLEPGRYAVTYTVRTHGALGEGLLNMQVKDAQGTAIATKEYTNSGDVVPKFGKNDSIPHNVVRQEFTVPEGGAGDYSISIYLPDDSTDVYLNEVSLYKVHEVDSAVQEASEAIEALPAVDALTFLDSGKVAAARALYDALDDAQKAQIPEELTSKLTAAEARIYELTYIQSWSGAFEGVGGNPGGNADDVRTAYQDVLGYAVPGAAAQEVLIDSCNSPALEAGRQVKLAVQLGSYAKAGEEFGAFQTVIDQASADYAKTLASIELYDTDAQAVAATLSLDGAAYNALPVKTGVAGYQYKELVLDYTVSEENAGVLEARVLAGENQENAFLAINQIQFLDAQTGAVLGTWAGQEFVSLGDRDTYKLLMGEDPTGLVTYSSQVSAALGRSGEDYEHNGTKFVNDPDTFMYGLYAPITQTGKYVYEFVFKSRYAVGDDILATFKVIDGTATQETSSEVLMGSKDWSNSKDLLVNNGVNNGSDVYNVVRIPLTVTSANAGHTFEGNIITTDSTDLYVKEVNVIKVGEYDEAAIKAVEDLIDAIGEINRETYEAEYTNLSAAEAAVENYLNIYGEDAASDIKNLADLRDARAAYDAVIDEIEKEETIAALVTEIDAISEIELTRDNIDAVQKRADTAQAIVEGLIEKYGEEVTGEISNYDKLTQALADIEAFLADLYVARWKGADLIDAIGENADVGAVYNPYTGYHVNPDVHAAVFYALTLDPVQGTTYEVRAKVSLDANEDPDAAVCEIDAAQNGGTVVLGGKTITKAEYDQMEKSYDDYGNEYVTIAYQLTAENSVQIESRFTTYAAGGVTVYGVEWYNITEDKVEKSYGLDILIDGNIGRQQTEKCQALVADKGGVIVYSSGVNGAIGRTDEKFLSNTGEGYLVKGVKSTFEPGDYIAEFVVNTKYAMSPNLLTYEVHLPGDVLIEKNYTNDEVVAAVGNNESSEFNTLKLPFTVTEEMAGQEIEFAVYVSDFCDTTVTEVRVVEDTEKAALVAGIVSAIDAIGEVTQDNYTQKEELIAAAEGLVQEYNKMYQDVSTAVSNYDKLTDARRLADMYTDAADIIERIDALDEVTADNYKEMDSRVRRIEADVEELMQNEEAEGLVTNLAKLEAARAAIDGFKKAADAQEIIAQIDAIGEINSENLETKKSEVASIQRLIDDYTEAYGEEALSDITNMDVFEAAQETIARLEGGVTYGDLDGNGLVEPTDALMVLNAYVGNETLTDEQKTAADVDLNDEIDPTDAMLILQKYVDLVPELPVVDE